MFDQILEWIKVSINQYGLIAVFFGSIIEEVIAPIPSPAVMMEAGAVILSKYDGVSAGLAFDMTQVAIVGALGALVGSYVMFFIGYYGGRPLIEKTQRFTGVKWSLIEKFEKKFESGKKDEITIAGLRALPVMPSVVIALGCGVLRINPLSYSISFVLGGIVRNFIFLIIGWQVGEAYMASANGFENVQKWVERLIIFAGIALVCYIFWRKRKSEGLDE